MEHITQIAISALVGGLVTNVVGFFVLRMLKKMEQDNVRRDNDNNLRDRKLDCMTYALSNMNGQFNGFGKSFKEKYQEEWERRESEDKIKYRS